MVNTITLPFKGYYCSKADGPITDFTLYPCPLGSYCPVGTTSPTSNLCPVGRYGDKTQLESADDCDLCPAGKFCGVEGLTSVDCLFRSYYVFLMFLSKNVL